MPAHRNPVRPAQNRKRKLQQATRSAMFERLEAREVMTIALVGTELRVTGSDLNDQVAISLAVRGPLTMVVASHTKISNAGQSTESRSFGFSAVASVHVSLGNGDNRFLNSTSLPSRVIGGAGQDTITGGSANDELFGVGFNDVLKGGGGNDLLEGGSGNDVLDGGDGNDSIRGGDGNDRVLGGNGDDALRGDAGNDSIDGGANNDRMYGGVGSDSLVGGNGDDLLYGEMGEDILVAGSGNDRVSGGDDADRIYGNDGDDKLYGDSGDDLIEGGIGADEIWGGFDNDQLHGHSHWLATTDSRPDGVSIIRGGQGDDWITSAAGNDVIYGEFGADLIDSGDGNDRVSGGADDDKIHGGRGDDELNGDDDNDTLRGGLGNDRIFGGLGNDLLYANGRESGPDGQKDHTDTLGNLLDGGGDDDKLTGSNKNDELLGGNGQDWINALEGNDRLDGGGGNDVLLGGSGVDRLEGNFGIDRIVDIDGVADVIIPEPPPTSPTSTVRREYVWIDEIDRFANIGNLERWTSKFPELVHVVNQYRAYDVNTFIQYRPPIAWGISNLPDPDPRTGHAATFANFRDQPLFGPNFIGWEDVRQGDVGTCYFLARLAALADTRSLHIYNMVTEMGDGTFVVQFLNQAGQRVFVRVDADLYTHNGNLRYAKLGTGNSLWVAIVEKAWAIHRLGYATYDSISGGNTGSLSDDRTDTAIALGIQAVGFTQAHFTTPQLFANALYSLWRSAKGVTFGGRSFIGDEMELTPENFRRSEHILMLHSVDTDLAGNVHTIRYYDLYGGPLKEMKDLDVFFFGCGGISAFEPFE